jgi:uncharacterized membrane protein
MSSAVILGLLAAFFFSLNMVLLRKAILKADLVKATFIVIIVGIPILLVSCILNGDFPYLFLLDASTIFFLALAGIVHFAVGRTLQSFSVRLLGAPRTDALTSTSVIYAPFFAVIFLSDPLLMNMVLGVVFIALGSSCILLSTARFENERKWHGYPLAGIMSGLACGAAWGITPIFVRVSVLAAKSPLMSLLVSTLFATISYYALLLGTHRSKDFRSIGTSNFGYLVLSGTAVCLAQICRYIALSLSNVSSVEPLIGLTPMITLFLSPILIRGNEKINGKMIIGILSSILGIYFMILI